MTPNEDYINLASTPHGEECTGVKSCPDYLEKMRRECHALKNQLIRMFGTPPEGARFSVKTYQHDFGPYSELVCYFDTEKEEAYDYALKCENELPEEWDEEAKEELSMSKPKRQDTPSMEQMEEWLEDGVCEATDGCLVEPDGVCPHGCKSWLLAMGIM